MMIREEILLKYLNDQCTPAEKVGVENWKVRNQEDFALMEAIFIESSQAKNIKLFDVESEWDAFMDMVDEDATSSDVQEAKVVDINQHKEEKPISLWRELRPAILTASVLLIAVVTYLVYPRQIVHLAGADGMDLILPDETKVTLAENATVTYPSSFNGKETRTVILDGVATFDVTPDPDKPFIVQTNLAGIQALGTIYEVDASELAKTGVKNIEGLINFYDVVDTTKSVQVEEGESFSYDGSTFENTSPPDPVTLEFPIPKKKISYHSVREVINRIYAVSNGHTVHKGDNIDWNKKIPIDLETNDLNTLLQEIQNKASVTLIKRDCSDCYEIRSFRVRNTY